MTDIAFLGFGEAARAFHATLSETDPALTFAAWDIELAGPGAAAMARAMTARHVTVADGPAALARARRVFSAVTADQSLIAVRPLLPALSAGATLIDINSVSPARKRETSVAVASTGATYVDMAVMAPVHPRGHRTPVLIAGDDTDRDSAFWASHGFAWRAVEGGPGAATAIKMVRSVFVKGLEAITAEALLAAERSGCRDEILASLSASFPGLGWPGHAQYVFDRTLTHGTRRAAEMRESAATLDELGLTGALAQGIADVQATLGRVGTGALRPDDLDETLRRVSDARLTETRKPGEQDVQTG